MTKENVIRSVFAAFEASRLIHIPFLLITLFPFFAVLLETGKIVPFEILLFLLAFVFAMAAGFVYNTICDADKDPEARNPITRRDLSIKRAFLLLVLFLAAAILFFIFASRSIIAISLFGVYLLIGLSYSGLGIRFKENILGPAVASVGMWSAPSALLLLSFNYYSLSATLLLFGLFVAYTGYEIEHTVIDHDSDLAHSCRTFAVVLGKKRASVVEYATLILGSIFLLAAAYYALGPNTGVILFFAGLFIISITYAVWCGLHYNYNYDLQGTIIIFVISPYIAVRMFIIAYGFIILGLPLILAFFVLLISEIARWAPGFYLLLTRPAGSH
jgi:4-hydroxybenzoate polyprenyltransferase